MKKIEFTVPRSLTEDEVREIADQLTGFGAQGITVTEVKTLKDRVNCQKCRGCECFNKAWSIMTVVADEVSSQVISGIESLLREKKIETTINISLIGEAVRVRTSEEGEHAL